MARSTKPAHLQRLVIIVMVHLHIGAAAGLARLLDEFTPAKINARITPGIIFAALFGGHGVGLAPCPHVS